MCSAASCGQNEQRNKDFETGLEPAMLGNYHTIKAKG